MYSYYFIPKVHLVDDSNLFKPFRIVRLSKDFPLTPEGLPSYNSLDSLRKNDRNWKEYHANDPSSANKICEEKFIIKPVDFIITPLDEHFQKVCFTVLHHSIMGKLGKDITGIHLYSSLNRNIKQVIQIEPDDFNGVWIADIEYYSEKRDKIYWKRNSSMFPKHWDPTTYMFKIYSAFKNQSQPEDEDQIIQSKTECGIPVEFLYKNKKLRTVYPIYQFKN